MNPDEYMTLNDKLVAMRRERDEARATAVTLATEAKAYMRYNIHQRHFFLGDTEDAINLAMSWSNE